MDSSGFIGNLYIAGVIILIIGILLLGIWLGTQIKNKELPKTESVKTHKPQSDPKPQPSPQPDHHPYPPNPEPGSIPGPTPTPPVSFNPILTLNSATINPASKEIHVKYKVDSDTPIPPTKTYTINFFVLINDKHITESSEDEPLHQTDLGFEKDALLLNTGIGNTISGKRMQVQAQIHYYASDGTTGNVGTPQLVSVA